MTIINDLEARLITASWSKGALRKILRDLFACKQGLKYVTGKTLAAAWNRCEDGRLLRWWVSQIAQQRDDKEALECLRVVERTMERVFTYRQRNNSRSRFPRLLAIAIRANFNYYGKRQG